MNDRFFHFLRRLPAAVLLLAVLPVFFSCGSKSPDSDSASLQAALNSSSAVERAEAVRNFQTGLLTDAALEGAQNLLSTAGRARSEKEGLIREAIDYSDIQTRYYSVEAVSAAYLSEEETPEGKDLTILDYGPRGEIPAENRRPTIFVMFNQAMVPLAQLGRVMRESEILSIDPPVEGRYTWYGTKTLSFRPDEPLLDSPFYRISVSGSTRSLAKGKLREPFVFDLFGERLKMVNMFPGNDADADVGIYEVPPSLARELTVEFNQPVDPETVGQYLIVRNKKKEYAFTVSRPDYPERLISRTDRAVLLRLETEPSDNARLDVVLPRGAVPFENYPSVQGEQKLRLYTLRSFEAEELDSSAWDFPQDNRPSLYPVYLHFSHPLAEDVSLENFRIEVDGVPVKAEETRVSWSTAAFYLNGIKPGMKVEVTVPPGITDRYGRTAPEVRLKTEIPRPRPMVEFPRNYGLLQHLEAEFPPSLVWLTRNVTEGTLGLAARKSFYGSRTLSFEQQELDFSSIPRDTTYFHKTDLTPYLLSQTENGAGPAGPRGTVFLNYQLRKDPEQTESRYQWVKGMTAVQVTDLGLTVRSGYNRVLVWVNRLSDGTAAAGADVTVFNLEGKEYYARADAQGLAVIDLAPGEYQQYFDGRDEKALFVRAELAGDLAEMKVREEHNVYAFGIYNTVEPQEAPDFHHRIHIFTDRELYKSGEELALRGIHWLQNPDGFEAYDGNYHINISDGGDVLWEENGSTSMSGGFSHRLRLPENLEPGEYVIEYSGEGFEAYCNFRIASFRRLNFQVTSKALSTDLVHGETVEISVQADNLAGGALPFAPYHYYWTRKPVRFVPPGTEWKNWSFGSSGWGSEQMLSSGDGTLSGSGGARISEGTVEHEVSGSAYRYTLETTVEDVDRQLVSSIASAVVHPASYYVAARFEQGAADGWWSRFIPVGDTVKAAVRLVDIQGGLLESDAVLQSGLIKGEWRQSSRQGLYGRVNTSWEYVEEEQWSREVKSSGKGGSLEFSVDKPGSYTLYFEYLDSAGRKARTEIDFYATGSGWVRQAGQTPSDITMVPDREIYQSGETARILVQSPVPKGRYLLTLEREKILEQKIIELDGSNSLIEIPLKDAYLPVFYVVLSSFTERTETEDNYFEPDFGRPRSLFGITALHMATTPVELEVKSRTVQDSYAPGEEAEVLVTVTQNGQPVENAEVTVLAVDRGVLDLADYHIPNPLNYFYNSYHFPLGTLGDDSRRLLLRPVTYEVASLQGGSSGKLSVRKDFNPLALFEPAALTDKNGQLRLKMKLPDTLTTYRLTAVALKKNRLGMDENEFKVSNPVNVRAALPRRFRNRDSAAAGVILTNTTEESVEFSVSADSDILKIAGAAEKTIQVPGKTSVELPFLFEADRKGEGRVRFTLRSTVLNEVLEEKVIVEQPIAAEAFTTVGTAAASAPAEETLVIPEYSAEGYGGLSLVINSSFRPYIEDSFSRLKNIAYPSMNDRLYTLAALAVAGNPDTAANEAAGLFKELAAYQFENGGIGYRSPSEEFARPHWFPSALAAQVDVLLEEEGVQFENPLNMRKLNAYLLEQMQEARKNNQVPFLAVWSARILAARKAVPLARLAWLEDAEDRLGLAGYYLLSQAFDSLGAGRNANALYQRGKNFLSMGTQTISLAETYEKREYFSSGEVELALFLEAAAARGENEELLMRIASSLDQNRNARRFRSSFDDFWILMGFRRLLNSPGNSGNTGVKVELAEKTLLEEPAGSEPVQVETGFPFKAAPLSELPAGEPLKLNIINTGEAAARPLYYAAVLRYALPVETAPGRDEGVEVYSRIETLDGTILEEDKLPLGETLRVRVNLSTPVRRSFLKLLVPVPSGAEIVDAGFATTSRYSDEGGTDEESFMRETVYGDTSEFLADGYGAYGPEGWWFWFYRPVKKIYDNAVSYLWEDFYSGSREITFLIRTTSPGIYPTPPVSASLEFEPEVFGRESGKLCIIRGE